MIQSILKFLKAIIFNTFFKKVDKAKLGHMRKVTKMIGVGKLLTPLTPWPGQHLQSTTQISSGESKVIYPHNKPPAANVNRLYKFNWGPQILS